jgi:uncharacterized protein (TIGR02246 family)
MSGSRTFKKTPLNDSRGIDMPDDEQQIRQLVTTWMAATNAADIDTVLDLMTDDVIFLLCGQPPIVGKANFASAARASAGQRAPQFDGTSEIQEIKVLGDWAFMWTRLSVIATPPQGRPVTRAGHTLSILRKENGKWRLARDANMLVSVQNGAR